MKAIPKTLVVLTPAFPANELETSWVTTQQLFVRTLQTQFPSLNIIVLSLYYPYKATTYQWNKLKVISFEGMKHRKLRRVFFWNRIWQRLKIIRQENDVIGLFSFWCGECALIGHYFARRYGLRHFCWLCGQDARAANKMVKYIRPRPSELIAMSDFLVEEFYRNHHIRPQYMLPNGIDPASFPAPPENATAADRDIDVLGVGALSPLKRYGIFVDIVGSLKITIPNIRAQHCGSGDEMEKLQTQIDDAGLTGNLALLGEKSHGEALRLMQRTKVFLHTSSYEGFGVVCLEALYAGAEVISFTRPMKRDIPGWHIVTTPEEMAAKALEILSRPAPLYESLLVYSMADTVRAVMDLFNSPRGRITS